MQPSPPASSGPKARRIAEGDVECLADLLDLAHELDAATGTALEGLRGFGYSWAEIAARLGTTRQAAQQRWDDGPADLRGEAVVRVTVPPPILRW